MRCMSRRIAVSLNQYKTRRVIILLTDIEARATRFLYARTGIGQSRRLERLNTLGLYLDMNMKD